MKQLLALLLFVPSLCLAQAPTYVPADGLVAYYTWDEGSLGDSGLTPSQTAEWTTNRNGETNKASWFNGNQEYVTAGLDYQDFTISAWVLPDGANSNLDNCHGIVSQNADNCNALVFMATCNIPLAANFQVREQDDCAAEQVSTGLEHDTWQHLVFVREGGQIQSYRNGMLEQSGPGTSTALSPDVPLRIGSMPYGGLFRGFEGGIDDVGIWNRALSEAEIQSLFSSVEVELPEHVPNEGLVAWYPLDGNALDLSGLGHDGIVNGPVPTIDRFGNSNGAYHFNDASSISANLQGVGNGNVPVTISSWVHIEQTSTDVSYVAGVGDAPYVSEGTVFGMGEYGGSGLFATMAGSQFDAISGTAIPLNQWVMLTAVHEGDGSIKLYVDSTEIFSFLGSTPNIQFDVALIGTAPWGGSFWSGDIDEVGIWSRALTEEEVHAMFLGVPIEYGCTDSQACNYDAEASVDDGSCVLPPEVDLGPDVLSCSGTAVLSVPEGDASYTWSTGETLASIVVTESGSYSVTAVLDSPEPTVDGFQFLYTSQGLDHFLSNSTATWSQAHLICQQNGGDLVSISDGAANSMLGIIDVQDAWIGLYQDDNNAPWQWTDGSNFDFQNWRSDQPSGSDQHCVLFWPEAAPSGAPDAQNIWSDETCTDVHHFLMAKPTASYSCEASDTINVHILDVPDLDLGEAVALCDDGGTLDAGPGFSNYAWSNGEDTQMIDVLEEGEYSVTTTFGGAPPNISSVELEGTGGALESAIQTTNSLTDATWMGWFWFDDLDAPQGLLAQNNGYNTNGYYINTNPFFDTATSTGGSSNSAIWFSSPVGSTNQNAQSWTQADAILPMTWHHIAVVLENGLIHIHVDGIAATMHNSFNEDWLALYDVDQHVVEASDAPFRLGSGTDINGNVDQVMRGRMDGISLWNRALTLGEIQGYMNCPPSSGSNGIQALWTFEDPSPLEDQSDQGHDATLASGQIVSEAPVSICPSCTTQDTVFVVHMDCEGLCGDGTVWDSSLGTCVSECEETLAHGQCGTGTVWDPINEECIVAIPTDTDFDGCVTAGDVLNLLATFGTCPPYPEWPD